MLPAPQSRILPVEYTSATGKKKSLLSPAESRQIFEFGHEPQPCAFCVVDRIPVCRHVSQRIFLPLGQDDGPDELSVEADGAQMGVKVAHRIGFGKDGHPCSALDGVPLCKAGSTRSRREDPTAPSESANSGYATALLSLAVWTGITGAIPTRYSNAVSNLVASGNGGRSIAMAADR